jgi:hypothetical protein
VLNRTCIKRTSCKAWQIKSTVFVFVST